jgi:hypothetical protein
MINTARTTLADVLRHEELKEEARRDAPDLKRSRHAVQLGYSRAENTFQLAIRSVTIEEFVNAVGEFCERIVNPGDPQPLIKASRNLRIDALGLIPALTDAIEDRVQELLSNVEQEKHRAQRTISFGFCLTTNMRLYMREATSDRPGSCDTCGCFFCKARLLVRVTLSASNAIYSKRVNPE